MKFLDSNGVSRILYKVKTALADKLPKTMTGANSRVFEVALNNDDTNVDMGWNWANGDGAGCAFRSANFATAAEQGAFVFYARKATGSNPSLMGFPDGTLKWQAKNLDTYNVLCSCTTAATTAAKTVSTGTTFVLSAGQRVSILFSATNTANNPTLNVNGTGAKEIYYLGSKITSGVSKYFLEGAQEFIYDGTRWHLMGTNDTVNTAGCSNATSKLFLVGTKTQVDYGQSYTRSTCYIGTDGYLYSNGQKVDVSAAFPKAGGTLNGSLSVASGDVILGHTGSLHIKNSDGSQNRQVIGITDNKYLDIGWGTATQDNILTRIWGRTDFVDTSGEEVCGVRSDCFFVSKGHDLRFSGNEGDPVIWCDDSVDDLVIDGVYGKVLVHADIEASAFIDGSDSRLKDIKGNVEITAEQIASLPAVKFTWKKDADKENRKEQVGTIAQEVQKILPEAVSENKDGMLGMQYGQAAMVSVINLAKTVVEQQKTIEALTKRLEALEKKIQ